MKKSLFLTMLAAALMGGQVFAEDAIPTAVEGDTHKSGSNYIGVYNTSGDASGGNVTVSYSETGSDLSGATVTGGRSTTAAGASNKVTMTGGQVRRLVGGEGKTEATGNTVTMTGGQVNELYGGKGSTAASENTVTMTGGQVNELYGGQGTTAASGNTVIMTGGQVNELYGGLSSVPRTGVASGNVAIVAGDCTVSSYLYGGDAKGGGAANDNKIYLVGKGATATIADAQGKTATYTGGEISLWGILVGYSINTTTGNSLDIYGTGITSSGGLDSASVQILNFHIAGALAQADEPMFFLNTTRAALNLTGVTLGFCSDDVQDWSAFDGQSITLADTTMGITIDEGSLGDVEIKGADGAVLATASLALGNEGKSMVLSSIKGATPVPEPATGTLSLLALAGLCARRRRK